MGRVWKLAVVALMVVALVAGCAATPSVDIASNPGPDDSTAPAPDDGSAPAESDRAPAENDSATSDAAPATDVAWQYLQQIEGELPARAAAAVVEDAAALEDAWDAHGFDGQPPAVDFADRVVLLVGQADDACPDELVHLEVVDGALEVAWLPPPGGCIQPLIMRVHAVVVHRGVLGEGFTYGLDPPYESDLEPVSVTLPPYDGTAPPAPEPPRAMSDADLDAVFADHPVRRCGPEHEVVDFGRPTDDERDRRPVARIEEANDALAAAGIDIEEAVIPFVDRSTGGRLAYFVGEQDVARVDAILAEAFGDRAPDTRVTPWGPVEVTRAADALRDLMSGDREPGSIVFLTAGPGPAELGMVDPTREALDAVADRTDPRLVCVDPLLSGVDPHRTVKEGPATGSE